jgi:putative iron-only hydrogenase system regulator
MQEMQDKRLAVISIIIEEREQSAKINALLSQFGDEIIGRMGVPYKQKGVNVICVVIDATAEEINTLTGKIGMIEGVTAKTIFNKK